MRDRDRAMFYWSKLFTSELESGEDYNKLKPAITINILNFVLFPEREDYHAEIVSTFRDTNEIFYEKFRIHFFELKKIGKNPDVRNRRELWLQFINADSEEAFDMIVETNDPVMKKAVRIIYDMSEDSILRERARMREKALHDEASLINGARAEGRAEGIAEGEVIGEQKVIDKMKAYGMTDEQIKAILSR